MDIVPLAGMLFSLLTVIIIAGSILMFPIMRRLGKLLEIRIEERRKGGAGDRKGGAGDALPPPGLESLRELVEELQAEVGRLAERQEFTDRLLERGRDQATSP